MQLLEREEHLALLDEALAEASSGSGRMVLIGGEAGVGKTSLVRRFASRLKGARVAMGTCDPLPIAPPLGPVLDMLPDLGPSFQALLDASRPAPELFAAIASLLGAHATPLILVFEDVHWADQATLDLLGYLGRRIERLHALVIATYRTDSSAASGPLAVLLGTLATTPGVVRLELEPLSRAATAELAAEHVVDLDDLYRRTGGNPFFITQVLGNPGQAVPPTVRDAVLARLAQRSPETRQALQAAAALGGRIDPPLLARIIETSGIPRWSIQEAISAGFLEQAGPSIIFRHELVQAAIAETTPPEVRARLHATTLSELRRRVSGPDDYASLVRHAEAADDDQAVMEFAPPAAARAAALGAHREATELLSLALARAGDNPGLQAHLLESRGIQHYLGRHFVDSMRDHHVAMELYHNEADTRGEVRNLIRFSYVSLAAGDRTESESALQQATGLVEELPPCREQAMVYEAWSRRLFMSNQPEEARQWAERSLVVADAIGEPDLVLEAHVTAAVSRLLAGDEDRRTELEALRETARRRCETEPHLQDTYARVTFYLALIPMVHRNYLEVDRYIDEGWQYAVDHQLEYWENLMVAARALRLLDAGRWHDAASLSRRVLAMTNPAWRAKLVASIVLARVLIRSGDPQARVALREAEEYAAHDPPLEPMLWPVRAEAAFLVGDTAAVRAMRQAALSGASRLDPWWRAELAFWAHIAGASVDAQLIAAEPFAWAIGGGWAKAARWWEERGCPYEMAVTLSTADSPEALRRAIAVLDQLGAKPAADYTRNRLRMMGATSVPRRPRASTSANPAGLTRREQDILGHVAQGLTNAEIARRLFLSEKTVERHLGSVFAKLKVGSRAEAVRAAAALSALPPAQN